MSCSTLNLSGANWEQGSTDWESDQSTDGVDGQFSSLIRQVRHLEVILLLHELTEDDFNLQNPVVSVTPIKHFTVQLGGEFIEHTYTRM